MDQILAYGIAAVIVVAIAWISIKTAMNEAKKAGSAEAKEKASEDAREAEQEMATVGNKEPSSKETKDKLKGHKF